MTTTDNTATAVNPRAVALATCLGIDLSEVSQNNWSKDTFEVGRAEYLVLTDDEANERAAEYIKETLWAFNVDFLASHFSADLDADALAALKEMQGTRCESANPLLLALVKDFDHLVEDAIASDGRGRFMSPYNGEELEQGEYFIYRTN